MSRSAFRVWNVPSLEQADRTERRPGLNRQARPARGSIQPGDPVPRPLATFEPM